MNGVREPLRVSRRRYIASLVAAGILLTVVIYGFGVRRVRFFLVPSNSMEPALRRYDYIVTMREKNYRRGDIVVFVDPREPESYLVKRIVGMPGDHLAVFGGALFINDRYASEPYVKEETHADLASFQVPEGEVFVLGDNRNESEDSISWGHGIALDAIVGRVRYIYNPLSRMGVVRPYPLEPTGGQPVFIPG